MPILLGMLTLVIAAWLTHAAFSFEHFTVEIRDILMSIII